MQVKTIQARDTQSALAQVKDELGPDAVILSTKNHREGGKCWCEVTAAVDAAAPSPTEDIAAEAMAETAPAGWGEWHQEWDQIKAHMMTLMRPQMDLSSLPPRQRMPLEHLEKEGVAEGVTLALLAGLRKAPKESILKPLSEIVTTEPFTPTRWSQKIHAVAGPSGSGKTTTLIRLALMHQQMRPGTRILVVNLDSAQGKGRLYLKHYAELSGMSYREASGTMQLVKILKESQKFDRIFMDLPAATRETTLQQYLDILGLSAREDLAVHLALSPLYAPAQLKEFLRRHKSPKTASIIWTKLDEACNYGDIVNAAHATGLPVSALSFGSGLRGTMTAAKPVNIWKLLFKKELPSSPIEEKSGRYAH